MKITVSSPVRATPRVMQARGLFDLPEAKTSALEWEVDLPLREKPWRIGLIVGPSGCGKSTVARHLWSEREPAPPWPADASILDGFPGSCSIKEITEILSSVGFSSPPAWLRPFHVLSTGQQFRVTLARLIAQACTAPGQGDPIVFDEYTSVVDRTVARVGSTALARTVRAKDLQFVAVTCHEDVEAWLTPDWVYRPAENIFDWRLLQRRPAIELRVVRCKASAWGLFAPHHWRKAFLLRKNRLFLEALMFRAVFKGSIQQSIARANAMARKNAAWFRKSKNTWYTTLQGKMVSLGVHGEENEQDAVKAWHRLLGGMAPESPSKPQETLSTPSAIPKPTLTVQAVLDAWLKDCEGRIKATTLQGYRYLLKAFLLEHGSKKADGMTPSLCEGFARKKEWTSTTQHDFLGLLAIAFRFAVKSKMLSITPLDGLRLPPKRSRGMETLLTAQEHQRLLKAATPSFRLFLMVLHGTGGRPGEVASISAENFDETNAIVCLADNKTAHKGKSRTLFLTPQAVALLKKQKAKHPHGILLPNTFGRKWTASALVQAMATTRAKAGVPHATCYGYRHSFATDALANGIPDAMVAELLGHSSTDILHKHYAHLGARTKVLKDALRNVR